MIITMNKALTSLLGIRNGIWPHINFAQITYTGFFGDLCMIWLKPR